MIEASAALNQFIGCGKRICRHQNHISLLHGRKSDGTLRTSRRHFGFFSLAANAHGEIQGMLYSVCCSGGAQNAIPQISFLPYFVQ